jgi:xanthine dehydrogenase molybdopterin-binding subunit B
MYFILNILYFRTPGIGYDFKTGKGNPFNYFTTGVACSEVEIDCLTGDHQVCYSNKSSMPSRYVNKLSMKN